MDLYTWRYRHLKEETLKREVSQMLTGACCPNYGINSICLYIQLHADSEKDFSMWCFHSEKMTTHSKATACIQNKVSFQEFCQWKLFSYN